MINQTLVSKWNNTRRRKGNIKNILVMVPVIKKDICNRTATIKIYYLLEQGRTESENNMGPLAKGQY